MRNTEEPNQCARLRETRERLATLLRRDKGVIDGLHAQIRNVNIRIANAEAELRDLPSSPPGSAPGTLPPTDRDEEERNCNRRRRCREQGADAADSLQGPLADWRRRNRLERALADLKRGREKLFAELIPLNNRYDGLLASRSRVRDEMRTLGCFNP